MHRTVFEVDRYCLKDIGTKFFPCLAFGEDAVTECAGAITTFLSVADFEDQLHTHRIPDGEVDGLLAFPTYHDFSGRLARRFLEHFREEFARAWRAADVHAVHAVLYEAQIAFPTKVAEHEAQALEFRRGQRGIIEIEDVSGGVRQRLRPALVKRVVFRFDQRGHHQGLERSLRP